MHIKVCICNFIYKSAALLFSGASKDVFMIITKKVYSCVLFSFMPLRMLLLLVEYTDAFDGMDGFLGRKKKD